MATETSPVFLECPRDRRFLTALGPASAPGGGARRPWTAGLLFNRLKEPPAEERPKWGQDGQQGGQRQQHCRGSRDDRSTVLADDRALTKHPESNELRAQRNASGH